jgi:hypothetical protein
MVFVDDPPEDSLCRTRASMDKSEESLSKMLMLLKIPATVARANSGRVPIGEFQFR